MASIIANQFGESTGEYRAALIGMGVVLLVLTVGVGMLARTFVTRYDRRMGVSGCPRSVRRSPGLRG